MLYFAVNLPGKIRAEAFAKYLIRVRARARAQLRLGRVCIEKIAIIIARRLAIVERGKYKIIMARESYRGDAIIRVFNKDIRTMVS